MLKILMLRSALLALALTVSLAAHAYASDPKSIDVPAGDLTTALQALAKQAGVEFVYQSKQLEGLRTNGLKGAFTPEDAVTKLLEGTPLTFRKDSSGAMLIAPPKSSLTTSQGAAATSAAGSTRLAQAEPSNPSPGTGEGKGEGSKSSAEDEKSSSYESQELPSPEETGKAIPEVLVIGSHSLNADIRRTEDAAQPYVVLEREQIERSMSTNLENFLKTRLPMNQVQRTNSQDDTSRLGNQSSINLRGLGTNQTLILVNGRRMPRISGTNVTAEFIQSDVNGIPLAAVERIEVLPSTASGIYGGGATGGVINIVLRQDYAGFEIQGTYENSFDADSARRRLDANAGFDLEGGKTQVLISGSYSDSDSLLVRDRDFAERGRALQLANNPLPFTGPFATPFGFTSNIRTFGGNLVLDDGTTLDSPITYVPVGYAGPTSDGGAALVSNAGQHNLDLADDVRSGRASLINNPTTKSLMANLRRGFGDRVEAFVDLSILNNEGRSQTNANVPFVTFLQPDAQNNPFQNGVLVVFPTPNLEFTQHSDSETVRTAAGVIVRLPGGWAAMADYDWSRSRFKSSGTSAAVSSATFAALANGTLDVMRDVNTFPLDFSDYLLPTPNFITGPNDNILTDVTLRLAGTVFDLPGGPLSLSSLLEHRKEKALSAFVDTMFDAGVQATFYAPSRWQTVDSIYLEALAPLVSVNNARPGIHGLELQASVRRDEYTTTSVPSAPIPVDSRDDPLPDVTYTTNKVASNDYTLGLRYSPIKDLVLRASYGTGFLPPSISQLVPSNTPNVLVALTDPKRGNVSALTIIPNFLSGGNADLDPEASESWSAGVIFTPRFVRGFRMSVDYTKIEKDDEIGFVDSQFIVSNEDLFPGRVIRGPKTDPNEPAEWAGPITTLDTTLLNISRAAVEAYDIQVDQTIDTAAFGTFNVFALATLQTTLERQALPTSPNVDFVGFSDGPLKWRGNAGVTWKKGGWELSWSAQYYDSYSVTSADPTLAFLNASAILSQGSETIPSQVFHDVFARYRFDKSPAFTSGLLSDMEIMFGMQNVFDKSPPILATSESTGGYSTYGDPRLRSYSISVRKQF